MPYDINPTALTCSILQLQLPSYETILPLVIMNLARSIRASLRKSLPPSLVSAVKKQTGAPDMYNSLYLLKTKGFRPSLMLDIGAYDGWWSKTASAIFPDANILMIEPLPDRSAALSLMAMKSNTSYVQALLSGKDDQEYSFYVGATGSSIYKPKRFAGRNQIDMRSITLDSLIKDHGYSQPDIIKIDVQGAEEDVIHGGSRAVGRAEVVIIELSIVNSYEKGLLVWEMISLMEGHGFSLYDIAGLMRANRTSSVNEFDGVFVRRDSPLWEMNYFLPHDIGK